MVSQLLTPQLQHACPHNLHRRRCAGSLSAGRPSTSRSVAYQPHSDRRPLAATAQLDSRQAQTQPAAEVATASCSADELAASRAQPIAEVSASCCSQAPASPAQAGAGSGGLLSPTALAVLGGVALAGAGLKFWYDRGSRPYQGNVGEEYDAWAQEGVLEYFWGEHIHLGYYTDEELKRGYKKKDFKQAKVDFVDRMLEWSGAQSPKRILDVGCGIGGTSRQLAARFPDATVTGITLSPKQVERATQLARERGQTNVSFQVMDALDMGFEPDSFDLVWACESGEHMPDKKKYVEAMTRVLKPGGTLVIACWCQREETPLNPITEDEKKDLQFLYDEWAHPFFISIQEFARLMEGTKQLEQVDTADWTKQTIASWRHSNWVGVWDPWVVVFKGPYIWYKVTREIVCLERMHQAFAKGLMQYGMMRGVKKEEKSLQLAGEASTEELLSS